MEDMEQSEFWTQSQRVYDPPITERGVEQAKQAAGRLAAVHAKSPFACVFSSPLVRCIQTAVTVAHELGLPVRIVRGLASCTRALRTKDVSTVAFGSLDELRNVCAATLSLGR